MRHILALLLASLVAPVGAAASLTGAVYSLAGDPVAGAEVRAYRIETPSAMRERIVRGEAAVPLVTATSAENGEFTLETKQGGVLLLVVEREGFAPATVQALVDEPGTFIELTPAATRTGRVTANGKPVSGATVVAMTESAAWTTRTNERGEYTLAEPKPWAASLVVIHPDYVPHTLQLPSLDAALVRGTAIRGKIVREKGAAVANARVIAGDWSIATTGDDGTFVLRNAPANARSIKAFDDSSAGSAPRGEGDVTIALERRGSIAGTVRDADNRPLAGAVVRGWRENTREPETLIAVTDEKGRYTIPHAIDGNYNVFISALGSLGAETTEVRVDGGVGRADLTVKKQGGLTGIVLDEAKKPVAGALVSLSMMQLPLFYGHAVNLDFPQARTGSDGRFRIAGIDELPSEDGIRLQATRRGYALGTSGKLEADQRANIVITLPKGTELHGVVTTEDGTPVAGAGILAIEEPFGAAPLPFDRLLASGDFAPFVESDREGKFVLHVNDKPYDLAAWKQGFAGETTGNVTANAKEPVKLVLGRAVSIRGRVDAKGKQPANAVVVAELDDLETGQATVGADGRFEIDGLRPGLYELQYRDVNQRQATMKVQAPASDVVLELAPTATIRGRVIDAATGRTLTNYSVRTESFVSADVDGEESFMLDVPPGLTELTVTAPGYSEGKESATATLEQAANVTVRMTRGRTITGRVTSPDREPIAKARAMIGEYESITLTGPDGEFTIDGASRDASTLQIHADGYKGTSLEIAAGEIDVRVEVTLSRGRSARGRVVTSDGAPVENASVSAMGEPQQTATTNAAGAFTIQGLGDEPYHFQASRDELESEIVEEAAGGELLLRMKPSAGAGAVHGTVEGFAGGNWQIGMVQSPQAKAWAMIGRDGKFRIDRITAGEVELHATAQNTDGRSVSSAPVKVTVAPGADVEVKLAFTNDVVVRGIVTDSNAPAIGVEVSFSNGGGRWTANTDTRGAYEIAGLVPDLLYDVTVESRRAYQTRHLVKGSSTFDIHIRWARVEGRVLDSEGVPISGAKIALTASGSHETADTKSDATGAFHVEVMPGAYTATIEKEGFATVTPQLETTGPPLLVTMVRTDGLRVRLLDARSGATLDGYAVAIDANGQQRAKASDQQKDGTLILPVASGTYRIAVSAERFASQSVRASVPFDGELRVALTPGGTLIVDADRAANDLVKLILANGEEYVRCQCNGIAEIRLEGTKTTIEHVAPGRYTMQVLDAQGRVKAAQPVTIVEGQRTVAEIRNPE